MVRSTKKNLESKNGHKKIREGYRYKEGYREGFNSRYTGPGYIVALIVWIILIAFGIYFLFKCQSMNQWPSWAILLLIVLMLIPGIGYVVASGVIIYGLIQCKQ